MKRPDAMKLKLQRALKWLERNKAKLESGLAKQEKDRAEANILKYAIKAENLKAELQAHYKGKKKVARVKKIRKVRIKGERPNESRVWLKPLSKNNLETKETIKPVYF